MLYIICKENKHKYKKILNSMHELRKVVFKDTLKWDVYIEEGKEYDQFDTDNAFYLVCVDDSNNVVGSTRLISTIYPYLLGDVFPELTGNYGVKKESNIWETTRFCGDPVNAPKDIMGQLALGMLEFGLIYNIKEYVSVSDIRIEKLIRKYHWFPERLGKTINTGTEVSAGERFPVNLQIYLNVRNGLGFDKPVIQNIAELPLALEPSKLVA